MVKALVEHFLNQSDGVLFIYVSYVAVSKQLLGAFLAQQRHDVDRCHVSKPIPDGIVCYRTITKAHATIIHKEFCEQPHGVNWVHFLTCIGQLFYSIFHNYFILKWSISLMKQ